MVGASVVHEQIGDVDTSLLRECSDSSGDGVENTVGSLIGGGIGPTCEDVNPWRVEIRSVRWKRPWEG